MLLKAVTEYKLIILTTTAESKLHNCFSTLWRVQIIAFFPPFRKSTEGGTPPFLLQADTG